jgi:hypothetical protein
VRRRPHRGGDDDTRLLDSEKEGVLDRIRVRGQSMREADGEAVLGLAFRQRRDDVLAKLRGRQPADGAAVAHCRLYAMTVFLKNVGT